MSTVDTASARNARAASLGLVLAAALFGSDALAARRVDERLTQLGLSREAASLPVAAERRVAATASSSPVAPSSRPPANGRGTGVGVSARLPTLLPPGYEALGVDTEALEDYPPRLVWRAAPHAPPVQLCDVGIRLTADSAAAGAAAPMRVGSAPVRLTTVGDASGVWIGQVPIGSCTGTHADGRTESGPLVANVLAWEQGGVRYRLMADAAVDAADVLRLATSQA